MRRSLEPGVTRECSICGLSFMTCGTVPIQLSQHRPPNKNPENGKNLTGICPRHKQGQ